jgi:hypothetical protein
MGFTILFNMLLGIDEDTGLPETKHISKVIVPKEFRSMMSIKCSSDIWLGEGDYVDDMNVVDGWFEDLTVDDEQVVESAWDADKLAEIKAFIKWMRDCPDAIWVAIASY